MIVTYPQAFLLLLLLPVVWWLAIRGWAFLPAKGRLLALLLRTSIISLVVTSLAGPAIPQQRDGTAVVFAVDQSASMSEEMKHDAQQFVREALATMGEQDRAAVVAFGRDPRVQRGLGAEGGHTVTADLPDDSATGIERALRVGRSLLSNADGRRIILVTDGGENVGDARREGYAAAAEGIEVSSYHLQPATVQPEVLIEALAAPSDVRDGEDFDQTVTVSTTVAQPATLTLWLDNQAVGQQQVELEPGTTRFIIAQPPLPPGFHAFRLTIEGVQDTQPGNNVAFSTTIVRDRARVLLIEPWDGAGQAVAAALRGAGVDVDVKPPPAIPTVLSGLRDYQSVILADVPAASMSLDQMTTLEQFVQAQGRGLLVIGGGHAYGLGGYAGTPLEAALPVSMDIPPREEEPSVALLLIIDKSGSMDYGGSSGANKMALAREAAVLATEELDPTDQIGVLVFDDRHEWLIPFQAIGAGAQREAVKQKIQSIQAGGGTEIFPALQTGYGELRQRTAQLRHVILLTDGKSFSGGDYDSLVGQLRQDQITLSTVGIGTDTDAALLQSLAATGGGRHYLTTDPAKIPQLVTQETKIASQNPTVEGRFQAQLGEVSPILRGVKPEDLPPLGGYVVTTPKPTAQRVLTSPAGDPVLAQWQYGLGRAVAWTPDAGERWAADWLAWPGFPTFLAQAVRWTMLDPANRNLQASVAIDGEEAVITLDAAEDDGAYIDLATATATAVAADDGSRRQVALRQVAPGRYQGRLPAGVPGAYRLEIGLTRPGGQPPLQDVTGFAVPYPAELRPTSGSLVLLHDLARMTGGAILARPQAAFRPTTASRATVPYPLWPWLLLAAALLLPIELAARRGLLGWHASRGAWRRLSTGRRA